ncbi:DEAD/DEAH box helicase [Actinoplanes sp. CA-252034]|uniref:DEAD/DEAH box helicase n=1 Tax=Actinoplanes sp. CA-252034 TaxID=3239906 RepID=UPI003D97721B
MVDADVAKESTVVMLEIDPRLDLPSFGRRSTIEAQYLRRIDEETIEVQMVRGAAPPSGWIRPGDDSGSRPQLQRQLRARQVLQRQMSLVRGLRNPISHDIGRRQWNIEPRDDLRGNAPEIIRDMLSLQPIYVLQGPPGSGKTKAASEAVTRFLEVERAGRVLVSAQSNFALDNLGERLIKVLPKDTIVLRIAPDNRETRSVAESIQPYTIGPISTRLTAEIIDTIDRRVNRPGHDEEVDETGDAVVDAQVREARRALAREWLGRVQDNQVELGERLWTGASVVLATCSQAATIFDGSFRLDESFDWVIVEEAAKAWPTELIVPLVLAPRWTLIGDHRQLGAHRGEEVAEFLDGLESDVNVEVRTHYESRAERLRALNLFESTFTDAPGDTETSDTPGTPQPGHRLRTYAVGRLRQQYRMHPDIAEPVRRQFYRAEPLVYEDDLPVSFLESDLQTTLKDHGVTRPAALAGRALVWVDTVGYPGCVDQPTWRNEGEVDLIERLVSAMHPQPTPAATGRADEDDGLVVLTPYRAQVRRLERRVNLAGRVHTVHSFQGHEADRVIVSLVRSTHVPGGPRRNVGHVGQDEVANVLLSRARRLLVLVGDFAHFAMHGGDNWTTLTKVILRYGVRIPAADLDVGEASR